MAEPRCAGQLATFRLNKSEASRDEECDRRRRDVKPRHLLPHYKACGLYIGFESRTRHEPCYRKRGRFALYHRHRFGWSNKNTGVGPFVSIIYSNHSNERKGASLVAIFQAVNWDTRPTIVGICNTNRSALFDAWAEAAGLRNLGSYSLDDRGDWSSEPSDVTFLDIGPESAHRHELVCAVLNAMRAADIPIVLCTTLTMVELVLHWVGQSDVTILCDPTEVEAISCLASLARARSAPLTCFERDVSQAPPRPGASRPHPVESDAFAEVTRASLEDDQLPELIADSESFAGRIEDIVRLRDMRGRLFGDDLFSDPVWNMLLDLMIARLRNRRISVTSLCIAAKVSETTALRWIRTLTGRGILVRVDDEQDGRRVFIELANRHANSLAGWLLAAMALPLGSGR